ncbi:hypothetical protein AAFC00_003962 [Neodothiora populina]|uniref:Rhodopsin domain-containing protein n=1 Tax=Neodothiora populina TaxID=2781224 RepID=A0ABR3PI58_9PEZI
MSSPTPTIEQLKSVPMAISASVFLIASWIVVALRIYVRAYMIRSFGWDDWLMVVTQLLFTIMCALILVICSTEINYGITGEAATVIATSMVTIFGIYIITTLFLKLTLCLFFLRVLHTRQQRTLIIITAAISVLISLVWFFIAIFQCGNPSLYLVHQLEHKCLDFGTVLAPMNYIHGIANAISDWIFAIVPILVVLRTQMTPRARASVIAILALGAAGSICSVIRLAYVHVLHVRVDQLFTAAPMYAIVSLIELGFGIVAACLATLRPLFGQWIEKASTYVGGMSSGAGRRSRKAAAGTSTSRTGGGNGTRASDHGIVMERTIRVGYESEQGKELKTLPSSSVHGIGFIRTSNEDATPPPTPTTQKPAMMQSARTTRSYTTQKETWDPTRDAEKEFVVSIHGFVAAVNRDGSTTPAARGHASPTAARFHSHVHSHSHSNSRSLRSDDVTARALVESDSSDVGSRRQSGSQRGSARDRSRTGSTSSGDSLLIVQEHV